jgi:hypothetical protein
MLLPFEGGEIDASPVSRRSKSCFSRLKEVELMLLSFQGGSKSCFSSFKEGCEWIIVNSTRGQE